MTLGARIQDRLKSEGLSQAELARRVGISQPAIYQLINSNKSGSRHIHRIARELHTTPAYLEGETDNPESDLPENVLSFAEREWLDLMRQLGEKDRDAVMHLTRSLAAAGSHTPTIHSPRSTYRAQDD
ncbi:helix-turn-helix domain-containing protein [Erythrobacter litoralis]|uniref:helix-turn-helix domain-containing protein n=1 Tax=Erythrobacter litoralis TaxID=39960 RepID=UPI00243482B6|nr:helix-turn-helix transcriptional regulator [Erythrobacter litoralis]